MQNTQDVSIFVEPQPRDHIANVLSGKWLEIRVLIEAPLHGPKIPVYSVRLAELCSKCLRGVVRLHEQPADQHELLYFTRIVLRGLESEGWYVRSGASEDGSILAVVLSTLDKDCEHLRIPARDRQEPYELGVMKDLFDGQDALSVARAIFRRIDDEYAQEGRCPPRW